MAVVIQVRRDTAANWTSVDPTLHDGEWGYETNTKKIKLGDGVTAWTSLDYWSGGLAQGLTDTLAINNETGGTNIVLTGSDLIISSDGLGAISLDNQAKLFYVNGGQSYGIRMSNGVYELTYNSGSVLSSIAFADLFTQFQHDVKLMFETPEAKFSGTVYLGGDATTGLQAVTYQQMIALMTGLWDDRGNFDASVNAYPSSGGSGTAGAILKGDIWTISVPGTFPTGIVVENGDTVRALVDTPGNTQGNWAVGQNNIGYVPENVANKDTDGTLAANSDTKYPSQKAVKTYVDNAATPSASVAEMNAGTVNTKAATPSNLQNSTYGAAKNVYLNNNFI